MLEEARLSIPEMVVAVITLVTATIAAVANIVSGDALVGLYGSVLGYVFGRARTGISNKTPAASHPEDIPASELSE